MFYDSTDIQEVLAAVDAMDAQEDAQEAPIMSASELANLNPKPKWGMRAVQGMMPRINMSLWNRRMI